MNAAMISSARAGRHCLVALMRSRRPFALASLNAVYLVSISPAAAVSPRSPELELTRCIYIAAGGHRWLERTLWGLRDQEGGWLGAEVPNANGSHDLGPLQVNSWWVTKLAAATGRPANHIRWWLINDACFNVRTARWIFLSSLAVTRDYWKAIGVYHSPTAWRQRRYSEGVARHLRRRFGPNFFRAAKMSTDGRAD